MPVILLIKDTKKNAYKKQKSVKIHYRLYFAAGFLLLVFFNNLFIGNGVIFAIIFSENEVIIKNSIRIADCFSASLRM